MNTTLRKATLMAAGAALLIAANHPARGQVEDPNPPPVPPGAILVEGDILIQADRITPAAPYPQGTGFLWPNGVVPFRMHANVSAANSNAMRLAMAEWEAVANVRFIPRTDEWDYLLIQSNTVNNSFVGRQSTYGFGQEVNIRSWGSRFTIVHELGHALGFWHEQSRSDRDQFVRIETTNIAAADLHNFARHDEANHYGPYDFGSVMHYAQCDFLNTNVCAPCSINCRTITVLPPNQAWQNAIGQRNNVSEWDARLMSFLYPSNGWVFVNRTNTQWFPNGTFLNPFPTFAEGNSAVPAGGTLWLLVPGTHAATGTHSKRMTIRAPLGGVVLR